MLKINSTHDPKLETLYVCSVLNGTGMAYFYNEN